MRDERKTKQQLIHELEKLRQRIAELELPESKREQGMDPAGVIEGMFEAVAVIGLNGAIYQVNSEFERGSGWKREEVVGETFFELGFISEEEAQRIEAEVIPELIREGFVRDIEMITIRRDGTKLLVSMNWALMKDPEGKPAKIITVARDITERKHIMEELQDSEERYRSIVENSPYLIYTADTEGKVLTVNKASRDVLGYEPEDVIGMNFMDFIPKEEEAMSRAMGEHNRLTSGNRVESTILSITKDGVDRIIEFISAPIFKNGEVIKAQGMVFDITDRKLAEEKLKRIFESVPGGVTVTDLEGVITEVNEKTVEIHGYASKDELLGKNSFELISQCDHERAIQNMQKTMEGGVVRDVEYRLLRKDGSEFSGELSASILKDAFGKTTGFIAATRDITERKRIEEQIKHRLQVEGAIASISRLFSSKLDVDLNEVLKTLGEISSANRAYIFQFHSNGKKVDNTHEWCSPETEPQIDNLQDLDSALSPLWMEKLHAGENIVITDVDALPAEAAEKEILQPQNIRSLIVVPIFMSGDSLAGFMGLDDTEDYRQWSDEDASFLRVVAEMLAGYWERKRAEAALRESEEKLRLAFASAPEGMIISDLKGKVLDINEAVVRMHGYDNKEELIGRSYFEFIAEGDHAKVKEDAKRTLERGSIGVTQYTLVRKGGSEFLTAASSAVMKDANGQPAGFVVLTTDVTEQRERQEQLILADRLASVGQLAAGIAHEINNPLTGVIGFSDLLLENDFPEEIRQDLEIVNKEAKRAADVIKGLLTFVRSKGAEKSQMNINNIVQGVLQLRSYEQRMSNIEVDTRLAPDLPRVTVNGAQIQQVFMNLIINAEQAMLEARDKGRLKVTTEKAGDIIRVSVSDDGPGISHENVKKLFTPFFTTKEVGKGTGLGLSICHGIVTEHGGRIYAESEPGKGATFVVELLITAGRGGPGGEALG